MDESRIHELARKVGGRFRLAALIQRRLLELNRGQRQLVADHHRNPLYAVLQEVEEEKVTLAAPEEESEAEGGAPRSVESPPEERRKL